MDGGPTRTALASGGLAVTTHNEDTIRVWNLASGDEWFALPTNARSYAFTAMSPTGGILYYPDEDGVLRRLLLDPPALAEFARSRASRNFTVTECERFLHDIDCAAAYG